MSSIDNLTALADAELTLNADWACFFLAFMEMSHLPPERLLMYAQAISAAYPQESEKADPHHPLTLDAVNRWRAKMYDKRDIVEYRELCMEILDDYEDNALACCIAVTPIVFSDGQQDDLLGTLLIGFERRSELLKSHIIRRELSALDVLALAENIAQEAIRRLGQHTYREAQRYLLLPAPHEDIPWSHELHWLFAKNIDRERSAASHGATNLRPRCHPENATLDERLRLMRFHVQGHQFATRYDLWHPMHYVNRYFYLPFSYGFREGDNELHYQTATAAVKIRSALRKAAAASRGGNLVPRWEVQSRARRKTNTP